MKKWLALIIITAVLLTTATAAFATVLSKTTEDLTTVIVEAENVTETAGLVVEIVTPDEAVQTEFTALYQEVAVEGKAPIEHFPPAVQAAVADLITGDIAPEKYEMNEFVSVQVAGYEETYGTVKATFVFATVYDVRQNVCVLFGLYNGEKDAQGNYVVEWLPMPATVAQDGAIQVVLPPEIMRRLEAAAFVSMAVLSEPLAAQ